MSNAAPRPMIGKVTNREVMTFAWQVVVILLCEALNAAAYNALIIPAKLLSGGVVGGALLLNQLFDLPVGLQTLIYNIPIFNTFYLGAINAPFVISQSFQSQPALGLLLQFANPFPVENILAGGAPSGLMYTNWYKAGYAQKWSFGIQREQGRDPEFAAELSRWLNDVVLAGFEGRILPFDLVEALRAGALPTADKRPTADAMIAATALAHDLQVVTRNVAHFKVLGAPCLDPWRYASA